MAWTDDNTLNTDAVQIRDETTAGLNTALRVGGMLENLVDSKLNAQKVTVSLSAAQIASLDSTPITALAGVASNYHIPIFAFFKYTFGSVAFNAVNVRVNVGGAVMTVGSLIDGVANANHIAVMSSGEDLTAVNTAVTVDTDADAGGLGDGTLDIELWIMTTT